MNRWCKALDDLFHETAQVKALDDDYFQKTAASLMDEYANRAAALLM
jgi:hypothetical protein